MTTIAETIEEVRHHLLGGTNEMFDTLDATINSSATTLAVDYSNAGIQPNVTLAVDLEEMLVPAVTLPNVTVIRAVNGSTAAAHTAGALIYIQPKFSPFRIFNAIKQELASLSSPENGLFKVTSVTATYTGATSGYDLTSAGTIIGEPLEVRYRADASSKLWPVVDSWSYASDLDTTVFASGKAIFVHSGAWPGHALRVLYRSPFTLPTTTAQDLTTDCGVPATASDVVALGAAMRLMIGREVKRNFTEHAHDARNSEEVPPGAVQGSYRGIAALHAQRVSEEAVRLQAQYPTYRRV